MEISINRKRDIEYFIRFIDSPENRIVFIEGPRGIGKTSTLYQVHKKLSNRVGYISFLISLSPYLSPAFLQDDNTMWCASDKDIEKALSHISRSIGSIVYDGDKGFVSDYLARILQDTPGRHVVLLIDSIYECGDKIRDEVYRYLILPLLGCKRATIILTGRGKRPLWKNKDLTNARVETIHPLRLDGVYHMLDEYAGSGVIRNYNDYYKIFKVSGGYPLTAKLLAESTKPLADAASDVIDALIMGTLPNYDVVYSDIRRCVEKLSLINIPFTECDVKDYLFGYADNALQYTNALISVLSDSHLIKWQRTGYKLDDAVHHITLKWLKMSGKYAVYRGQLENVVKRLEMEYSDATPWYIGLSTLLSD